MMKLYLDVSCLNRPFDDQHQARIRIETTAVTLIFERIDAGECGRAKELEQLGFKPADAVHVAAAERAKADLLLSCDDRFCRLAKRRQNELQVRIVNPVDWLKEMEDADA